MPPPEANSPDSTQSSDLAPLPREPDGASRISFPVVAIGASAGGLEAFVQFLQALPPDPGMAFVVVQHLPPQQESMIAEILSGHTKLTVKEITDGDIVQPNHVYVICPGRTLTIQDGQLKLGEPVEKPLHRRPVDDFFRSLAAEQRQRAICVVMSGMGSNGTAGAKIVKAAGGICIAQDPDSARFSQMPRSLIEAGGADFILSPAEMPNALLRYVQQPYVKAATETVDEERDERPKLTGVLGLIHARLGLDFTGYKSNTIVRRIRRRMGLHQITEFPAYATMLRQNPGEIDALAEDLMIHVTGFFRDAAVWETMRTKVIEPLVEERAGGQIRAWVPACATGEEAYTLAMLLKEAVGNTGKHFGIKVFATDTAERTLRHARIGVFPGGIESELTPERLARFFEPDGANYRVTKELRELVVFAPQNILQDPPYSRLDLCSCRNLLIYLQPESQERVLSLIHFGLKEGGYLLLGTSETTGGTSGMFEVIDKKSRVFRRLGPTRHGVGDFPASPLGLRFSAPAVRAANPARPRVENLTQESLLRQFAPPAVAFNRLGEIAYYHGDTAKFLDQQHGVPTRELLTLARPWIKTAIWTAMQKGLAGNQAVTVTETYLAEGGTRMHVDVTVSALGGEPGPSAFFLMTFNERPIVAAVPTQTVPPPTDASANAAEELHRVRSDLRAAMEQLQNFAQEKRLADQEATSVNEELQSVNEEMETSREELQSLNEELTTVNSQLRAKMEEAEATSSDLSSLLTSTAVAVVFLDANFNIRRFTPAARDLFDLIPGDVGRPLNALARLFKDDDLLTDARLVLESLIPKEAEVRSRSGRSYMRRIHPYRTGENRIEGVVLTFLDITDRKRTETALQVTERRQRLVLESVKEYAIFSLGADGRIESWPTAAELIFGFDSTQAIGREFELIFTPEDRAAGVPAARLTEAREKGRSTEERWYVGPDRERFWGSGMLYALRDAQESLSGFVVIVRDTTSQRLNAEAANENRRTAEEANETKDRFLANVSHELRTPLSGILLWARLLTEPGKFKVNQLREAATAILRCAEEQQSLIEDLMDSSRIAAGKLRLELHPTRLNDLLRSAIKAIRLIADERQLKVDAVLDPLVGTVSADPHRLYQVVWNLLTNATKFSELGGKISVRSHREGQQVVIEVTDSGQGISPDMLPRVFDRFSQGQTHAGRAKHGLGLGLGIARELVGLHEGSIVAESAGLGLGATFRVRLPLRELTDAEIRQADSRAPMEIKHDLSGMQVLVVEDSNEQRSAMQALLKSCNVDVTVTANGEQAVEKFKEHPFEVVLCDIGLPGIDGYEVARQLLQHAAAQKWSKPTLIAITAYANEASRRHAFEQGFEVFFSKPINPIKVMGLLKEIRHKKNPVPDSQTDR